MIDRRLFLKLTGCVAAATALEALPVAAQGYADDAPDAADAPGGASAMWRAPGTYQLSGRVRLQDSVVAISGITNAQQISWSPGSIRSPVASFTSFERFDQLWLMPEIRVRGGELEALTVLPLDVG